MQQLTSLTLTPDRREAVVHGTPEFPPARRIFPISRCFPHALFPGIGMKKSSWGW